VQALSDRFDRSATDGVERKRNKLVDRLGHDVGDRVGVVLGFQRIAHNFEKADGSGDRGDLFASARALVGLRQR
jgi:hypothetical protein